MAAYLLLLDAARFLAVLVVALSPLWGHVLATRRLSARPPRRSAYRRPRGEHRR